MTRFLLSVHVLAVIVTVGPVTVAASRFPAVTRRVRGGAGDAVPVLASLHRICRVYAGIGIVVPVFGLATARSLGVLGSAWLVAAMALTAVAAGVLGLLVLPRQSSILATVRAGGAVDERAPARLGVVTGLFTCCGPP